MIFDSHAHYDDPAFDADRDELLAQLPSQRVGIVMNVGTDIATSLFAQQLSDRYDYIYNSAGVHPHAAADVESGWADRLRELLAHPKTKAVGEIGLDYYYPTPAREVQREVFETQLQIAVERDLPVVVHMRDATEDTMALLRQYNPRGVVHCFSGSRETALEVVALGMYVGFTGMVTFPKTKHALEAAQAIPFDRLLIETDAPYMAPVPMRGKRCDSSMLVHTAAKLAELLERDMDDVIAQSCDNAKRLFGIG